MKIIYVLATMAGMALAAACHKSPGVNQTKPNPQSPSNFDGSQESLAPGSRH